MKKVKSTKKTTQSKKKIIIISVIILAVLILGGFLIGFLIWQEETKPVLIDNLSFEINSDVVNKDLLLEEYEIIDEENLKTDELGEHEYTIRYKKGSREKELTFTYSVVDTTKPEISADDTYEITEGEEVNFKDKIKISDNSKEDIQLEIEGEYDVNKVGEYQLKVKAKDSSGNESEKDFKLIIKEKPQEQINNNSNTVTTNKSVNRGNYGYNYNTNNSSNEQRTYNEPAGCKNLNVGQLTDRSMWSSCQSVDIVQCDYAWKALKTPGNTKYWDLLVKVYGMGICDRYENTAKQYWPEPTMEQWVENKEIGGSLYIVF